MTPQYNEHSHFNTFLMYIKHVLIPAMFNIMEIIVEHVVFYY